MKFKDWFIEQHGKRPSSKNILQLINEADMAEKQAVAARRLVEDCREWELRQQSALYAWWISDKEKDL